MLIDVTNSGDRSVTKKETEKILKYKNLITEIQLMWNVNEKVIPVIIRTTGKYFKITRTIPEKHNKKTRN
jgi:hypothetical protein